MKFRSSFRFRIRVWLTLGVLLIITISALLMANEIYKITQSVSKDYAGFYNNELVKDIEAHLNREIGLSLKLANTNNIKEWLLEDTNENLKLEAYGSLQEFNDTFTDHNVFVAVEKSKNFYFIESGQSYEDFNPNGTLSESRDADSWYFETLKQEQPYLLNIDIDRFLNIIRIWTNMKVQDQGQDLGIVGTGLTLDVFINEIFVKHQNKGAKTIIMNEFGAIQLDSDLSNIEQNSFKAATSNDNTIFEICDEATFVNEINAYLAHPESGTTFEIKNNRYQYASIESIHDTHWFAVTFFETKALYNPIHFVIIFILIIVTMALIAGFISVLLRNNFIVPFEKLRMSIAEKEVDQTRRLYGLERQDEFGVLSRTIQQMTDRLVQSVPVGMFLLNQEGRLIYGNAYFLNQFGCTSKEEFEHIMTEQPERLFVQKENINILRERFKTIEKVYVTELECISLRGSTFWAEIRLSRVMKEFGNWQIEGILLNIQDKVDYETKLIDLANTDKLTKLINRHRFDCIVQEEINRSNRYGGIISMMIFDLDHFKMVNDRFGHAIGDEVLLEVAQIATKCIRQGDTLARWGGEEFVVLLPETRGTSAYRVAEKIRQHISELRHPIAGQITASFGVAQRTREENYEEWFVRVDQSLYSAKEQGRNQTILDHKADERYASAVKLVWEEAYNCGNFVIDNQHQQLFRLVNDMMESAIQVNEYEKSVKCFSMILEHLRHHLMDEENILTSLGYPAEELKAHKNQHDLLRTRLVELNVQLESKQINTKDIFFALIDEVIVQHMLVEDVKFHPFMREES